MLENTTGLSLVRLWSRRGRFGGFSLCPQHPTTTQQIVTSPVRAASSFSVLHPCSPALCHGASLGGNAPFWAKPLGLESPEAGPW